MTSNNLMLTTHQLEIVKKILKNRVSNYTVWVFGSRVKGTSKKTADLDLAIISDKPLPQELKIDLAHDFDESLLPFKVDIVDWSETNNEFRNIISQDKVIIQNQK